MININLLDGIEQEILSEDTNRIKAIIKNNGNFPVNIDYLSGASPTFTIPPGGSLTVEGGGNDVFATSVGGASELQIDNRIG